MAIDGTPDRLPEMPELFKKSEWLAAIDADADADQIGRLLDQFALDRLRYNQIVERHRSNEALQRSIFTEGGGDRPQQSNSGAGQLQRAPDYTLELLASRRQLVEAFDMANEALKRLGTAVDSAPRALATQELTITNADAPTSIQQEVTTARARMALYRWLIEPLRPIEHTPAMSQDAIPDFLHNRVANTAARPAAPGRTVRLARTVARWFRKMSSGEPAVAAVPSPPPPVGQASSQLRQTRSDAELRRSTAADAPAVQQPPQQLKQPRSIADLRGVNGDRTTPAADRPGPSTTGTITPTSQGPQKRLPATSAPVRKLALAESSRAMLPALTPEMRQRAIALNAQQSRSGNPPVPTQPPSSNSPQRRGGEVGSPTRSNESSRENSPSRGRRGR